MAKPAKPSQDGALLVRIRNGCLKELYERCLLTGFRGRCNGSRSRKHPSPVPGSNIILGNEHEVVVIHQEDHGRGRLVVRSYMLQPGAAPLFNEVVRLLAHEPDLEFVTYPSQT